MWVEPGEMRMNDLSKDRGKTSWAEGVNVQRTGGRSSSVKCDKGRGGLSGWSKVGKRRLLAEVSKS